MKAGIISYINSIPLGFGLERHCEVVRQAPAELAKTFADGHLDVSFMPSVAYLRGGRRHALVDGLSISSFGPTNSVFLCLRKGLGTLRSVALNPESMTSNFIVREILGRKHGIHPKFMHGSDDHADARIVIGDKALDLGDSWDAVLDVGTEWMEMTGLPMVYAVCVARNPEIAAAAGRILRHLRDVNLGNLEDVLRETGASPHLDYIRGLDYGLGIRHRKTLGTIESLIMESETHEESAYEETDRIHRWQPALQAS